MLVRNPINTLRIRLQNPRLDHVSPDSCGVIVVPGDNRVEFLLGIFAVRGNLIQMDKNLAPRG